jgi:capsular polysaccharide biosynthesis protein
VDFATALRMVLRRWYVAIPVLMLTATSSVAVAEAVQPSYQVAATVVLLVPDGETFNAPDFSSETISNPYLQFTNSLKISAEVVSIVLTSDMTKQRLKQSGLSADYEVVPSTEISPTPILTVTSTSRSERDARRTLTAVVRLLRTELARRQISAGAAGEALIQVQVASPPTTAKRVAGSTIRAVAITVALGLTATFAVAFLAEVLADRRRLRRGRRSRARSRSRRKRSPEPSRISAREGGMHLPTVPLRSRPSQHNRIDEPNPATVGSTFWFGNGHHQ